MLPSSRVYHKDSIQQAVLSLNSTEQDAQHISIEMTRNNPLSNSVTPPSNQNPLKMDKNYTITRHRRVQNHVLKC